MAPLTEPNPHEEIDVDAVRRHLRRAVDRLLALQDPAGYWCGELEGDSILESEYILLKWIIRQEHDQRLPAIADYLRWLQQPDGAWVQYPGAKPDLSATVKGYFALKLSGDDPQAAHMVRARELIRSHGGAERANTFSKYYLAMLGQIDYTALPSIPPEIVYLPRWFYFHLDKVSAWTRTMIAPLSIITSAKPIRQLPAELGIDELYVSQVARHRLVPTSVAPGKRRGAGACAWSTIFLALDKVLKLIERTGLTPLRERALQRIERWIVAHTDRSDGLGAIFPPMVYIQIALRCRGYGPEHPLLVQAAKNLDSLMIRDDNTGQIRLQPCFSPVWDTGIAAYALSEIALADTAEALQRAAGWLVSKECRQAGDWVANVVQDVAPSGWFFEYRNGFYPDVDDTAMVAMALRRSGGPAGAAAAARGVAWLLAMQSDDGGWAAFDRTAARPILEHVPFADHNAIQDPSCPDITGRTLECLGQHGLTVADRPVRRALDFIRRRQEPEGCWFGRWGVNYIYGTWQVVCGLARVEQDMTADWVQLAGRWLDRVQHDDGAFGESADSYEDPSLKGRGPPTASQTAWGAMALMAIRGPGDPNVRRAIRWLCRTQLDSGTWDEAWFTGTGFPQVFYLRYHLYRLYFPVLALARWQRLAGGEGE